MRQVQKEIADAITAAQEESGMTQKEFAGHIGVSTKILAYWKNGKRIPRDIEVADKALAGAGKTVTLGKR